MLGAALGGLILGAAPPAHGDVGFLCAYPMVGISVNVGGVQGFFCDGPTEINGTHMHCQGGGLSLGLGFAGTSIGNGGTLGFGQSGQGAGGLSCNWRCPDNSDGPAPNPPGAWKEYLIPMRGPNFCADHMAPAGFWSNPVLPTEGIPPAGQGAPAPGEILAPQPTPPPQPNVPVTITPAPGPPLEQPPLSAGEPNP